HCGVAIFAVRLTFLSGGQDLQRARTMVEARVALTDAFPAQPPEMVACLAAMAMMSGGVGLAAGPPTRGAASATAERAGGQGAGFGRFAAAGTQVTRKMAMAMVGERDTWPPVP